MKRFAWMFLGLIVGLVLVGLSLIPLHRAGWGVVPPPHKPMMPVEQRLLQFDAKTPVCPGTKLVPTADSVRRGYIGHGGYELAKFVNRYYLSYSRNIILDCSEKPGIAPDVMIQFYKDQLGYKGGDRSPSVVFGETWPMPEPDFATTGEFTTGICSDQGHAQESFEKCYGGENWRLTIDCRLLDYILPINSGSHGKPVQERLQPLPPDTRRIAILGIALQERGFTDNGSGSQ